MSNDSVNICIFFIAIDIHNQTCFIYTESIGLVTDYVN